METLELIRELRTFDSLEVAIFGGYALLLALSPFIGIAAFKLDAIMAERRNKKNK